MEEADWFMPADYVTDLRDNYPLRPLISIPFTVVHGMLDTDIGGGVPSRIKVCLHAFGIG